MIVYGELLFAENAVIGGVLIYITSMIHGIPLSSLNARLRFLAGSLMCGAFSMAIFIGLKSLPMIFFECVFSICLSLVVFGRDDSKWRIPWQKAVTFILTTYFMAGIIMGILLAINQPGIHTAAGIYTGDMKAGVLALLVMFSTITVRQVIKVVSKRKLHTDYRYTVRMVMNDREMMAEAFLDTGNRLKDPMTGRSVAVASDVLWSRMQRCGFASEERFAVVPYRTVGGRGLLDAVRMDYIVIAAEAQRKSCGKKGECLKRIDNCLIARGEGKGRAAGCELLISAEAVDLRL